VVAPSSQPPAAPGPAPVETVLSRLVLDTPAAGVPDQAIEAAARQVLDTVGVALAAAAEPAGHSIARVVGGLGGAPQARVLGTRLRTSVVQAAWANGSLAHLLDFDDSGFSHPTACILPAALAVAEHRDVSGRDLLTAMVLGYEVFERLSRSARGNERRVRRSGYHPTPIYGSLAAVAAAARLLQLDVGQLEVAFGLAASDASGLTQQFGTWGKGLHAGNAARAGVMCTLLARDGYWGDERVISGPYGLFEALHGEGGYDFGSVAAGLGERWAILDPGLSIKAFPACGINRRPVAAVLRLAERTPYDPDMVERIDVHVHPQLFHTLRHRAPDQGFRGKFSLDYTLASAVLDRRLVIDSFSDDSARRPELRAMLDRVVFHEHPEQDVARYRESSVQITLSDGTVLVPEDDPSAGWLTTREEITAKYLDCAERALPARQAAEFADAMWSLPDAPSIRKLVDSLVPVDDHAPTVADQ
jgi:2-methylcitrate dehydratase PrpD